MSYRHRQNRKTRGWFVLTPEMRRAAEAWAAAWVNR